MTDRVDETLALWRRTAFEWGERDCMLSIGDYIARQGGQDVTGRFRGSYASEEAALAYVEAAGGAAGLVDLTGLPHTDSPQRGDVVVFDPARDGNGIGAICTGSGIAARTERGVIEVNMRLVKIVQAWKVP